MKVARSSALCLAFAALSAGALCAAHPFGLSSTNRLFALEPDTTGARVAYVLDLAELPTTEELARLDRDRDGQVTAVEREAYLDALFERLQGEWRWSVDGRPTRPRIVARSLEVGTGEGNLNTLRVVAELRIDRPLPVDSRSAFVVSVRDESYSDRPGWRELRVESSSSMRVVTESGEADPSILARRAAGERVTLRMNEARWRLSPVGRSQSAPVARPPSARRAPVWALLGVVAAIVVIIALARRRPGA